MEINKDVQKKYKAMRAKALKERKVTDKPVSVERVRMTSMPVEFTIDPNINIYK